MPSRNYRVPYRNLRDLRDPCRHVFGAPAAERHGRACMQTCFKSEQTPPATYGQTRKRARIELPTCCHKTGTGTGASGAARR